MWKSLCALVMCPFQAQLALNPYFLRLTISEVVPTNQVRPVLVVVTASRAHLLSASFQLCVCGFPLSRILPQTLALARNKFLLLQRLLEGRRSKPRLRFWLPRSLPRYREFRCGIRTKSYVEPVSKMSVCQ